jgi:hypothetical protein
MEHLNAAFGLDSKQLIWGLDTDFKELLAQNALISKPTKKAKTFPLYDGKNCLFARASRGGSDQGLKILVEEVREVVSRSEITPTGAFNALKEKLLKQNIRAGSKSSWQGTKGYLYILQGQVVDGKQTVPFDFKLGVPRRKRGNSIGSSSSASSGPSLSEPSAKRQKQATGAPDSATDEPEKEAEIIELRAQMESAQEAARLANMQLVDYKQVAEARVREEALVAQSSAKEAKECDAEELCYPRSTPASGSSQPPPIPILNEEVSERLATFRANCGYFQVKSHDISGASVVESSNSPMGQAKIRDAEKMYKASMEQPEEEEKSKKGKGSKGKGKAKGGGGAQRTG